MKRCLIFAFIALIGWHLATSCNSSAVKCEIKLAAELLSAEPPRPAGQTDVVGLRVDPIPVVRVGLIGAGMRGPGAIQRFMNIEGVEVIAVCDLEDGNIERVQEILRNHERPEAAAYTGEEDWKKVCEREDIDLIYVCTNWDLHSKIAVYAMDNGKHVVTELPMARTIADAWDIVNAAERNRRHCMLLANCTYDFFEMATLNMAQQGIFGEIVHVEGAYIHDLRELKFNDRHRAQESFDPGADNERSRRPGLTGYWNHWRLTKNAEEDGNLYPQHGLGPLAQVLNLNRGDRMDYMVSLASNEFGMTEYAKARFGENSDEANRTYRRGDINTTLIKTVNGKSIKIQHDVTSPRPYSRIHMISGTKGFAQKWPRQHFAFDRPSGGFSTGGHGTLSNEEMEELLKEYEHPITQEIGELARRVGGHGGMDFIMDYRLMYCLQNGLPLDVNVYDGVSWASLIELSRFSIENGSYPVRIPDFTRGAWNKQQGFRHAKIGD